MENKNEMAMNSFTVYSRLYTMDNRDNVRYLSNNGRYAILEPVEYGTTRGDLARFLDDDLKKHVIFIKYYCVSSGYIAFSVMCNCDLTTYITNSDGLNLTLQQHVLRYISGQISDGWGESGIHVLNYRSDSVITAALSETLYEVDHQKVLDILSTNEYMGYDPFEDFSGAFKEIPAKLYHI